MTGAANVSSAACLSLQHCAIRRHTRLLSPVRRGGAKTFIDTEKSHSSVTIQLRAARRRNAAELRRRPCFVYSFISVTLDKRLKLAEFS